MLKLQVDGTEDGTSATQRQEKRIRSERSAIGSVSGATVEKWFAEAM